MTWSGEGEQVIRVHCFRTVSTNCCYWIRWKIAQNANWWGESIVLTFVAVICFRKKISSREICKFCRSQKSRKIFEKLSVQYPRGVVTDRVAHESVYDSGVDFRCILLFWTRTGKIPCEFDLNFSYFVKSLQILRYAVESIPLINWYVFSDFWEFDRKNSVEKGPKTMYMRPTIDFWPTCSGWIRDCVRCKQEEAGKKWERSSAILCETPSLTHAHTFRKLQPHLIPHPKSFPSFQMTVVPFCVILATFLCLKWERVQTARNPKMKRKIQARSRISKWAYLFRLLVCIFSLHRKRNQPGWW